MIFKNILLAYQLENYDILRFLKFIYLHPKFWIYGSKRQVLEYTDKLRLIFTVALLVIAGSILCIMLFTSGVLLSVILIGVGVLLPFYFVIAHIIIYPLDSYLKWKIISQAKKKISQKKNLKVIAITGSYGKTTTKEILHTILSQSFQVLSTPGNINTPVGISRVILELLTDSHEIFIVEMGAYTKGNISELCNIVKPQISIITGITLQHLERFQSLENIIDAKFEIIETLGKDDIAIIDSTSLGVQTGLKKKQFKVTNIIEVTQNIDFTYLENLSGIEFDFYGEKIQTELLGDYIGKTLQICFEVSKKLGQDIKDFKDGVKKINFIEHRMQLIYNSIGNIFVLDDSYNGNLKGVDSIVTLLKKAPFRGKKIVVAGGIVELGEHLESENREVGRKFAEVSDLVLLVQGPVGAAIKIGLELAQFPKENIKIYTSSLELHEDIKNIVGNGDLIIFQNDLPDTYL